MQFSIPTLITGTLLLHVLAGARALPRDTDRLLLKSSEILRNELKKIDQHESKLAQQMVNGIESLITKDGYQIKLTDGYYMKAADNGSGCGCSGYNCGCCARLEWDTINLNDTVCANFTYLPAPDYGVAVTLSLDDKIIYKKEVSVRNPPPLCVGVPYLKEYASLCIKFTDLQWTNQSLQGCVYVLAQLEGFVVESIKLGCFKIPPENHTVIPVPPTTSPRYKGKVERILPDKDEQAKKFLAWTFSPF